MALSAVADDYFRTMNPIAAKIHEDITEAKNAYENIWDSLSEKEKVEIINESIIKPDIALKYALLDTLEFDLNDPPVRKDDLMSFFGREHATKVIQDENTSYRDEHSGPFLYQTKSQLNLCVLSEHRASKDVKCSSPPPVMTELALSHSKVVSELKNALKSHDVLKTYKEKDSDRDLVSPTGFISKFIGNFKSKDEERECLMPSAQQNQIVASSDNFFRTNFKSPQNECKFEKDYRSSVIKSSSGWHNKWHSFGLTNERRIEKKMELLREREMKRNMKKESQVVKTEDVKEPEPVEGTFSCNACDEVYTTKKGLKNHKLRLHKNRVRECRICQKSVTGYMAWRAHLKSHSNNSDQRFQCDECDKGFKYPHSLIKHKDTHLEKNIACEQCPKKFGSKALLNTHMKTHERQERGQIYHCSYCGKGFYECYTLQVHERTHRNERPYLCEICNTSFGTNSSLQRHLKVSHNSAKPWQCSHCLRNFMTEIIRDRHVLRHHGEQENFKFGCGQCARRYLTQKDLKKHIQKAHPNPGRRRGKKAAVVEEDGE